MHRSGTSMLTKSLECLGVDLGAASVSFGSDNPKGFWEDKEIQNINNKVLESIGLSWFDVKPINSCLWKEDYWEGLIHKARELIRKRYESREIWGFKDPRTSIILPFWKMVFSDLDLDVSYIFSIRNYKSVSSSLKTRNGISENYANAMWLHYNFNIIEQVNDVNIVQYESMLTSPISSVKSIAKYCDLTIDCNKLDFFVNSYIDHQMSHSKNYESIIDTPYSFLCEKLYANICKEAKYKPEFRGRVKELREQFEKISATISRDNTIWHGHFNLDKKIDTALEIENLKNKNFNLVKKLATLEQEMEIMSKELKLIERNFLIRLERILVKVIKKIYRP